MSKKTVARIPPAQQNAENCEPINELTEAMMTAESMEIDWDSTCEKCLGKMVKRRVIAPEGPKMVMQCTRCKFFHDISK